MIDLTEKAKQKLLKTKLAARNKRAHQIRTAQKNKNKEECEIDPLEAKESGFFIKANHITFDKKITKALSKHVEEDDLKGFQKMMQKKLTKSHISDLSVCVIGNSRCGKTTFIRNLFGGERLQATNNKTILQSTSYKLKQTSKIKISELLMPSSTRSRTLFQNHFDPHEFDLFFVFTDSWFTENIMWTVSQLKKSESHIIFVRTKIDQAIDQEMNIGQNRKVRIDEIKFLEGTRNNVSHVIHKNYDPDCKIHLLNCQNLVHWDGNNLIDEFLEWTNLYSKTEENLFPAALYMAPISPKIIQHKFENMFERIWKVALLSVSSRITIVDGFSLVGDLDILKEEIDFYFEQFYLIKKNMDTIDHNGDLELVWNLIRNGDGLKSLMKQASLDQKEEEVRKLMKVVPVIGGNVSFTSTYAVMSFILHELFLLTNRLFPLVDKSINIKCFSTASEMKSERNRSENVRNLQIQTKSIDL